MTVDDDDLPEIDQIEAGKVADALAATSTTARAIVDEHREDNFGEVLPTLLSADVGRWYRNSFLENGSRPSSDAELAVNALSRLYENGDESMQTIVATGFLEALPHVNEEGRDVVELLPTPLREELRTMENWRPPEVTNE